MARMNLSMNNEIELCEVRDPECKQMIERMLLKNRISYFIRFTKSGIFPFRKKACVICVNENVMDAAEDVVRDICDEYGFAVKFLLKRSSNQYQQ
ncbi:MAG: hypothetical protein MJ114_07350 [Acetatifactor sp.]|nr:hypothetical protein [Acetatifactor sp.]